MKLLNGDQYSLDIITLYVFFLKEIKYKFDLIAGIRLNICEIIVPYLILILLTQQVFLSISSLGLG